MSMVGPCADVRVQSCAACNSRRMCLSAGYVAVRESAFRTGWYCYLCLAEAAEAVRAHEVVGSCPKPKRARKAAPR